MSALLTDSWDTPYSLANWRRLSCLCLDSISARRQGESLRFGLFGIVRYGGACTGKVSIKSLTRDPDALQGRHISNFGVQSSVLPLVELGYLDSV